MFHLSFPFRLFREIYRSIPILSFSIDSFPIEMDGLDPWIYVYIDPVHGLTKMCKSSICLCHSMSLFLKTFKIYFPDILLLNYLTSMNLLLNFGFVVNSHLKCIRSMLDHKLSPELEEKVTSLHAWVGKHFQCICMDCTKIKMYELLRLSEPQTLFEKEVSRNDWTGINQNSFSHLVWILF